MKLNDIGTQQTARAAARTLIGGGGGCIFIYSDSARLVSFDIKLISKEISRAEPKYMNIHPPPLPISVLARALQTAYTRQLVKLAMNVSMQYFKFGNVIRNNNQSKLENCALKSDLKSTVTFVKNIREQSPSIS